MDPLRLPKHHSFESIRSFGLDKPLSLNDYGVMVDQGKNWLTRGQEWLMPASDMKIKGLHNIANALAALALSETVGIPIEAALKALRTFPGLPHRCQFIREKEGVSWYNDSKGTTVVSTLAALLGFGPEISGKIVWIAGGLGKGADFSPLRKPALQYVRKAILIGRDADKIAAGLGQGLPITYPTTFEEAIQEADRSVEPGDIVLLSPACASYDMFNHFEHRGMEFERLVSRL